MVIGCSEVSWQGRTYPEILEVGESDGSVLLLPFGSVEQHGPHLPVSTDTILATAVAEGGASAVCDDVPVLVAPPVWTGFSPHHFPFGGTLSGRFETILHLLQDVVGSAARNGFDAILVINGHGGNVPLVGSAVNTLGDSHPSIQMLGLTYFDLAAPFVDEMRDSEVGGMSHAGEFETSLAMHLVPDLVREDEFAATPRKEPYDLAKHDMFVSGPLGVYRTFDEYTDSGVVGDPTVASAEKGEMLYDGLVEECGELIRSIHDVALEGVSTDT